MYHQQFAFKCNIPPKKRVRILMTSKWLRSDPNPFTHPHLWPKSFKEVGACPQRKNQPTMITWDTNFSKPTTPPRKMVIDFFGGQQTTNWTKRVFKKKNISWLEYIDRLFLGGGFYTEKEMWQKKMLLLKSFTSPYIHKPHIKGEESFSDSGGPVGLVRSPHFFVAGAPNQPTQLLPGIQFLGCSATFHRSPCLPVELSWFMISCRFVISF